jgi:hypothetical protein
MTHPGPLDSVTVEFDNPDELAAFGPPLWFGPEITQNPGLTRHMMALNGVPEVQEVSLTNDSREALLDLIDGASEEGRLDTEPPPTARLRPLDTSVLDALRRLSASVQSSPEHAPEASEPAVRARLFPRFPH